MMMMVGFAGAAIVCILAADEQRTVCENENKVKSTNSPTFHYSLHVPSALLLQSPQWNTVRTNSYPSELVSNSPPQSPSPSQDVQTLPSFSPTRTPQNPRSRMSHVVFHTLCTVKEICRENDAPTPVKQKPARNELFCPATKETPSQSALARSINLNPCRVASKQRATKHSRRFSPRKPPFVMIDAFWRVDGFIEGFLGTMGGIMGGKSCRRGCIPVFETPPYLTLYVCTWMV